MFARYDEPKLVKDLDRLPKHLRTAFAAACAERMVPAYVAYCETAGTGDVDELLSALGRLWGDLAGEIMDTAELQARIHACTALIPDDDSESWSSAQTYAEDAASAVTYALRTRQTGESQEAAWCARCAYEALDHYVVSNEGIDRNILGEQDRVMSHPLIQAELMRQKRDLEDLVRSQALNEPSVLTEIRDRAHAEAVNFFGPAS